MERIKLEKINMGEKGENKMGAKISWYTIHVIS